MTGREIESVEMSHRPSLLEFGPYRLDARRRLVWRGDTLLDVPPKAAELLAVLAGEAGQVTLRLAESVGSCRLIVGHARFLPFSIRR